MTTMYKDKEVKELLELLNVHSSLTFQSQLELQKELAFRGLKAESTALNKTIVKTSEDINKFLYLKDLGFEVREDKNSFTVTRTTKSVLIDLLAIILGLLLSMYGLIQLLSITVFAPENGTDFSISRLMMIVIYGVMILIGVKFLNGVKRFFDFLGFELSKSDKGIILKKRFDLKLEECQVEASSIKLVTYKGRTILRMNDDDIFDSNANDIVQKMTIESLYNKLRN